MRLFTVVVALCLALPVFSHSIDYSATHNPVYDDGQNSLNSVTCSTGEHGLITAGYKTFGSLPTFPYIGGIPQITSWNSRYCGTCWQLTYTDEHGTSTSLNVTAINTNGGASHDFTLSAEAMDVLTQGEGNHFGIIPITAVRVPDDACGL